jgi:hypothetical protein
MAQKANAGGTRPRFWYLGKLEAES